MRVGSDEDPQLERWPRRDGPRRSWSAAPQCSATCGNTAKFDIRNHDPNPYNPLLFPFKLARQAYGGGTGYEIQYSTVPYCSLWLNKGALPGRSEGPSEGSGVHDCVIGAAVGVVPSEEGLELLGVKALVILPLQVGGVVQNRSVLQYSTHQ